MAYSTSSPAGKAVQNIIDELPGLMAVAIVEISSGMALASHSNGSINPETAAAYNTEVVKQKQKAMTALKLNNDERIDDILITLTNQIHLINLLADGKKFIYLVVNSRDTNLAIARDVLRRQSEILL